MRCILVLTVLCAIILSAAACPTNFVQIQRWCYHFSQTANLNQMQAVTYCGGLSGEIAVIRSEEEVEALTQYMNVNTVGDDWNHYWIGLMRNAAGSFAWPDSSLLTYSSPWRNHADDTGPCVNIGSRARGFKWLRSYPCTYGDKNFHALCKIEPIEGAHTTVATTTVSKGVRTARACEHGAEKVHLECEVEQGIKIWNATYGRLSAKVCPSDSIFDLNCRSEGSLTVLERCSGKTSCIVAASNSEFGDPCPNTHKYLEVQYSCIPVTETTKAPTPAPTEAPTAPPVPTETGLIPALLKQKCKPNIHTCIVGNSQCWRKKCRCIEGYMEEGKNLCVAQSTLKLGKKCNKQRSPCADANSTCNRRKCKCQDGYKKKSGVCSPK